jgi:hypothetical protein
LGGDFPRFGRPKAPNGNVEISVKCAKGRNWRAFPPLPQWPSRTPHCVAGDAGADRTRLQRNSLQTGNFTGNFAEISLSQTSVAQETPEPQRLFSGFPSRFIREIIGENRDSSALIRENRLRFPTSASPSEADTSWQARHVSLGPIVLKKSSPTLGPIF